jgi:cobalt/nickel transport system ATP-binding protein
MSSVKTLYEVRQASYAYPNRPPSLVDIAFQIEPGERIALLGANGSGKSTLLHLLGGLYFPTFGSIRAFERELTEDALESPAFKTAFRKSVGFLFQNSDAQLFCPSVEEEIAFGPLQLGLERPEIEGRISDVLDLLEIAHLRRREPQTLSSGEQKRVALASVLAVGPSVLLLDEPTAGLDPRSEAILLDLLEDLHRSGMTLITATHDLGIVSELADRALALGEDHRLIADGPQETVLADRDLLLSANLTRQRRRKAAKIT